MDEKEKYYQAKKRVKELKGFYMHLLTYVFVNAFITTVNLLVSPNQLWFYWPLFGWGIGLAFHAMGVFGKDLIFGKSWEERKIKEIMERETSQK